ncbi:MAG: hypothetical protein EXR67_06675 [Dehalococcoidia bacterium]|nr:hypothetical protein [Dehalococcoidia bacterium]
MKNQVRVFILVAVLCATAAVGCSAAASPKDLAKVATDSQDQIVKVQTGLAKVTTDVATTQSQVAKVQADVAKAASSADLAVSQSKLAQTQADLVAAQNQIKTLTSQLAAQATLSAYAIWYDQYYAVGNYKFPDVPSFNKKLGSLIAATSDNDSVKSWTTYLAADKTNTDLNTSLPTDYKTWTAAQVASWTKAGADRYSTIGLVGNALFASISK